MEKAVSTSLSDNVLLREVATDDLPIFFQQQLGPDANHMAAFTTKDPADREAFNAHWTRNLGDETSTIRTILCGGQVAGYVSSYVDEDGHLEVSYWLGKSYWGKGIATSALSAFLKYLKVRPLYARAVKDNHASLRVLEKCGFTRIGEGQGFANARGKVVEEFILRLDEKEAVSAR